MKHRADLAHMQPPTVSHPLDATCSDPDCRGRHCKGGEHRPTRAELERHYGPHHFETQNTSARVVTRG